MLEASRRSRRNDRDRRRRDCRGDSERERDNESWHDREHELYELLERLLLRRTIPRVGVQRICERIYGRAQVLNLLNFKQLF